MRTLNQTLILSAVTLLMTACGGDGGVTEAATDGAGLEVLLSPEYVGQLTDTVFIGANPAPTSPERCPQITTGVAIDGNAVPSTDPGGWKEPGVLCIDNCEAFCGEATWASPSRTPPADSDLNTITVGSGDHQWTMTVQHLYAQRTVTMNTSGPVHEGDTITLTMSPATDDVTRYSGSSGQDISFFAPSDGGFFMPEPAVNAVATFGTGTVTFRVPTLAPGTYSMGLGFGGQPHVTECKGPAFCLAQTDRPTLLCDAAGNCNSPETSTLQVVVQ
jgi:hypothetical protein